MEIRDAVSEHCEKGNEIIDRVYFRIVVEIDSAVRTVLLLMYLRERSHDFKLLPAETLF